MKKNLCAVLGFLSLALFALPSQAQINITYEGYSTGGTMPGSPTDFIYFNNINYPPGGPSQNNGTVYSQLSSFSFAGGVSGDFGNSGTFSSIVTPAGGAPLLTGEIDAYGNVAFAVEPGNPTGNLAASLNTGFNLNDFNVYMMYSNTGGPFQVYPGPFHDSTISLAPRSSVQTGGPYGGGTPTTVSLDGTQAPVDNNTNQSTAYYLEFNVTGLATAIGNGVSPDLVASATGFDGITYIGALSFQSVGSSVLSFALDGPDVVHPVDLGSNDFLPVGNLTFDLTSLGPILTSEPGSPNFYTLISGSGFWDDSNATFSFIAPAGYVVARYDFDSFGDTFSVDFQVVPEPSTYALMLGGLAVLGACVRRKNARLQV
jgi:hypothetical protein